MADIPPGFQDLLTSKKAFASLATLMPDGAPQVTPVWFDYDGARLRINTAKGRVKDKNMRRARQVALAIQDPENPYRYLGIRGRVEAISEEGADAHIDALTRKYLGQERYPYRQPGEVRVTYTIRPERVWTVG